MLILGSGCSSSRMSDDSDLDELLDDLYAKNDLEEREDEDLPGTSCKTLVELAASVTGKHYRCSDLESHDVLKIEHAMKRILYWAFPQSEYTLKTMASLCQNDDSEWDIGENMVETNVQEIQQVGFSVSAIIDKERPPQVSASNAHVFLTFEKQCVTSSSCSCCPLSLWCRHIVAAILYRVRHPKKVPFHLPVMDTLAGLSKHELQTAVQYAIQEDPGGIITRVFKYIYSMRDSQSELNQSQGLPDPTLGLHSDVSTTLDLSLDLLQKNLIQAVREMRQSYMFTSQYCNVFDTVQKVDTPFHKQFFAKVKRFILDGNTDIAGRILIKIAKTVLDEMVNRNLCSGELQRLFYDVDRMFSCAIVTFTGAIRKEMIETALDLNGISAGLSNHMFLKTSEWMKMELPDSSVFEASRNAPFYQPLCASVISEDSQSWWKRFDQTTSNTIISEEPLAVVLLRFDSLLLLGGPDVYTRLCRLGLAILTCLLEKSKKYSIVGNQGSYGDTPNKYSDEDGPSSPKRSRIDTDTFDHFGVWGIDGEDNKLCMAKLSYCTLYICYTMYRIPGIESFYGQECSVLMDATLRALEMCRMRSFAGGSEIPLDECKWLSHMENYVSEKFLEFQPSIEQEHIYQWMFTPTTESFPNMTKMSQSPYIAALSERGIGFYGDQPALMLIKLLVLQSRANPDIALRLSCDAICYDSEPFKCFTDLRRVWDQHELGKMFLFFFEKVFEHTYHTSFESALKVVRHLERSTDLDFCRLFLTVCDSNLSKLTSDLQLDVLRLVLHIICISVEDNSISDGMLRDIIFKILNKLHDKVHISSFLQPMLCAWENCSEFFTRMKWARWQGISLGA